MKNTQLCCLWPLAYSRLGTERFLTYTCPGAPDSPRAQRSPAASWTSAVQLSYETLHCQSPQRQEQVKNMLSAPGISLCRESGMLANRGQRSLWPWDEFQGFNHWVVEGRGPSLRQGSKTSPTKQKINWNNPLISNKLVLITFPSWLWITVCTLLRQQKYDLIHEHIYKYVLPIGG